MAMFPPQSTSIFKLLLSEGEITAADIGQRLHIWPHSVYRALKPLIDMGCVTKSTARPVKYIARPYEEAANLYLQRQRDWFLDNFFSSSNNSRTLVQPNISFIQTRQELMDKAALDQTHAQHELDLIVSGDEVPAETMLINKKLLELGKTIRIIVQRADTNIGMLQNWSRMGIQVRHYPSIKTRLIIIDSDIVFIASYDPLDNSQALGVRFAYPPLAQIMLNYFEKVWVHAFPI